MGAKKKQFSKFRFRNYTCVRFVFCLRRNIIPISEGGYLGKQIRHISYLKAEKNQAEGGKRRKNVIKVRNIYDCINSCILPLRKFVRQRFSFININTFFPPVTFTLSGI